MPRIEGEERLALPRPEVWRLLNDPDTLAASIPGCSGFARDGDEEHRYRTAITVAIGPVTGVYEGTVEYLDVVEPERSTIVVSGKGDKGTIDGRGELTLTDGGESTAVGYVGEFKLTGPVAGVGQRMAPGVSRKLIVETLRNLEARGGDGAEPARSAPADRPAAEARSAPAGRSSPPREPIGAAAETFSPFSISPLAAFAAGCAIGLLLGARLR